ncbi:MAG: PAS domain-containing protein [Burkholderiales bacterium]|nr:PAS domain-containing protein [Burkholderiales bacterium]
MDKDSHSQRGPWRSYVAMLGLPLPVVLLVAVLAMGAVHLLGTIRACTAGESLWSKASAEGVQDLLRYAHTHNPGDMTRFRATQQVSLLNRQALEAIEGQDRDTDRARRLLIESGNPSDEVAGMVRLFQWLGTTGAIKDARLTWAHADAQITLLNEQAALLQHAIETHASEEGVSAILQRIDAINTDLQASGTRFSNHMRRAARFTEALLIGGIACISAALAFVSVLQVRRTILKQTRQEGVISQAQGQWELASAAAGLGLYEMDKATGAIQLDGKSAAMHGLPDTPVRLSREAVRALIIPEDGPQTRREVDVALTSRPDHTITYRVKHPDGSIHALQATGRLVHPPDGRGERLIGVLLDVTEALKQTEIATKRESAERVAKAQRAFLSRLSHELRTPLNAMLGFTQLLKMDSGHTMTEAQHQQLNWIHKAGQQLLALVDDVLDLSKVEAGEITMSLQEVELHQIVQACLPLIESVRLQRQVQLLDRTATTPLRAIADPQRLQQILVNLLTNGCKYNRPGGHVEIATRQDEGQVVIEITDNGIGMTPEDAAALFHPFKRVQASTAHAEGTGLGLYIVKQLAERMNGSVAVRSELGVGSCFTVRLPMANSIPGRDTPPLATLPATQKSIGQDP